MPGALPDMFALYQKLHAMPLSQLPSRPVFEHLPLVLLLINGGHTFQLAKQNNSGLPALRGAMPELHCPEPMRVLPQQ